MNPLSYVIPGEIISSCESHPCKDKISFHRGNTGKLALCLYARMFMQKALTDSKLLIIIIKPNLRKYEAFEVISSLG